MGGSYSETILFDVERFGGISESFQLDDTILNYDTIIIMTKETDGLHSYYIPTSEFYLSLGNSARSWANDDETLLLYPTSETFIEVTSTSNNKILKVIGVSSKKSKDSEEQKASAQLTASGIQALKDYVTNAVTTQGASGLMFAPLVAVSDTVLKYYDYNISTTGVLPNESPATDDQRDDPPLERFDYSVEQFKSMATQIETSDPEYPLYIYYNEGSPNWWDESNDSEYLFYYCEKTLRLTDTDKQWVNWLWNTIRGISLRDVDTSEMTNLNDMFNDLRTSEGIDIRFIDVTNWDTSNVESTSGTFRNIFTYVGDHNVDPSTGDSTYWFSDVVILGLQTWDMSNVLNTSNMFRNDADCIYMGSYSTSPYYYISNFDNWDLSLVTNADYMFRTFCADNVPMNLNFKNCKSMIGILSNSFRKTDSSGFLTINWNTPKVSDMSYMFACDVLPFDSSYYAYWDCSFNFENLMTNNVEDMSYMFKNVLFSYPQEGGYDDPHYDSSGYYHQDLSGWDTSNVTNTAGMFKGACDTAYYGDYRFDLSNWDMSFVTDMHNMFESTEVGSFGDIGDWNTRNVENFSRMFAHDTEPYDVDSTYYYKLSTYEKFGSLGDWNTSKARNMSEMFADSWIDIYTTNQLGIQNWDTSSVNNFTNMFEGSLGHQEFTTARGYDINPETNDLDLSGWDFSSVTDPNKEIFVTANTFDNDTECASVDFSNWKLGMYNKHMLDAFRKNANETGYFYLTSLYVDNWDITGIHSLEGLFENILYDNSDLDLHTWDTSNIYNMDDLFKGYGYFSGGDININLSGWNLSNCTHFDDMLDFGYYYLYNYSANVDMSNCIVPQSFKFGSLGYYGETVSEHYMVNIDASGWSLTGTDYSEMFKDNVINVSGLDSWSVGSITNMASMFEDSFMHSTSAELGYYGVDIDELANWDVSSVTDMSYMFKVTGYEGVEMDYSALNDWDISAVNSFTGIMQRDTGYETVLNEHYPTWDGFWDNDGTFYRAEGYFGYYGHAYSTPIEFVGMYPTLDDMLSVGYYKEEPFGDRSLGFFVYDDDETIGCPQWFVYNKGFWVMDEDLDSGGITATYTGSSVSDDTPLEDLVEDLTVNVQYNLGDSNLVDLPISYGDNDHSNGYTLSGTLIAGETCTITVTAHYQTYGHGGIPGTDPLVTETLTTTFDVDVFVIT